MPGKADLHIHTQCSDGMLTPKQVVDLAFEKKLSAVSITDHDTFEGYIQVKDYAADLGVNLIPGVEITSVFNGREAHILAYYFATDTDYFSEFLKTQKSVRKDRIKGIVNTLQDQKIEIDYNEVWAEANGANLGRPHIAKVLIDKGYVSGINEAFQRYLSNDKLGEIKNDYMESPDIIRMVKEVGGAAILAHPGRLYTDDEVKEFINFGIDGIECIHPSHNWKNQLKYSELCEKHSLLKTGGSDYHGGIDKADRNVGVITIAQKHIEPMYRMTEQRKQTIVLKD